MCTTAEPDRGLGEWSLSCKLDTECLEHSPMTDQCQWRRPRGREGKGQLGSATLFRASRAEMTLF